jgi:hypothetical protein
MRMGGLRWVTTLASVGAVVGGVFTLTHLPSPSGASSTTSTIALSDPAITYQRKIAEQAALVQQQLSSEVSKFAVESAQLAKEKAALGHERLTLQRDAAALARSSSQSRTTTALVPTPARTSAPTTHSTTGASSTSTDGSDGPDNGN